MKEFLRKKKMTRQEATILDGVLKQKQAFVNKALTAIREGKIDKAIKLLNIESGLNLDLVRLLEEHKEK